MDKSAQLNQTPPNLYGREYDFQTIITMLSEPDYRLVSIVGAGGIGKTFLARHVAQLMEGSFADGVYFVELQAVTTPDFVTATIFEAIGESLSGTENPLTQLKRYLKSKEMLIVLDNFEHLMDVAPDISEILTAASDVKILVTSREVLNISNEWVWTLTGLAFPDSASVDHIHEYAAIKLFGSFARQVNASFLLEDELNHVVRLCQLVEGIPLAIKIAVSWLRSLSCEELVDELSRSIDVLNTRLRDVPDYHRSIRTVFDHSWSRLSEQERDTLQRLSVFQGDFNRDAAKDVASASLSQLTSLIEKSLINANDNGRFSIHALLRQYAYEKLSENTTILSETRQSYARYYGKLIADLYPGNTNERQAEVTKIFVYELDNIRAVWDQIPIVMDIPSLRKIGVVIGDIYQFKAYYEEGITRLHRLIEPESILSSTESEACALQMETRVNMGWLHIRLGQIHQAEGLLLEAQQLRGQHNVIPLVSLGTDPDIPMGIVRVIQGNYSEATSLGQVALSVAHENGNLSNEAAAWYVLSSVALAQGDYDVASDSIRHALEIVRRSKDRWFGAYLLNQQGQIAIKQGNYETAKRYFEESANLRDGFDDPESMVGPMLHLAQIALLQANLDDAQAYFMKSLQLSEQLGDIGQWIKASEGLGLTYLSQGNYTDAHQQFVATIKVINDVELPPVFLHLISSIARFLLETAGFEHGIQLASFVYNHPLAEYETREHAELLLTQYRATLSLTGYSVALKYGEQLQLEEVSQQIQQKFPFYTWDLSQIQPTIKMAQPLIEPLTDRELEVLHLLAQGLSNTEIAERLTVVLGTVKTHNYNIFGKLGVKNRVQAVKYAREINLL